MTGFVGGNGAGKTTTMRMIMGAARHRRGHGRLARPADHRRGPPRASATCPRSGVCTPSSASLDQLVYLGQLSGLSAATARSAVLEHLERFGLAERAQDRVEKLSLGNQQRVQIIAALMADPEALILDEPFSGLDPTAVDSMADLLREHTVRGVPVLFSSHQLDLVERLCDRLVILARGTVVAEGSVTELRGRGPTRYRLTLDGDAGWVRDVRGVTAIDVDGPSAVVELDGESVAQPLLTEAMRRGAVREFARLVPALSEIYREVTA